MRGRPVKKRNNVDTRCDVCGVSFDSIPSTIRHRFKMHPNSTKFYCSYCGMQFPLKVNALWYFLLSFSSLFLYIIISMCLYRITGIIIKCRTTQLKARIKMNTENAKSVMWYFTTRRHWITIIVPFIKGSDLPIDPSSRIYIYEFIIWLVLFFRMVYIFQPIATPPPSNKIKLNSMNDALSVYYCHLCGVEYVIKFNLQQHLEKMHTQVRKINIL